MALHVNYGFIGLNGSTNRGLNGLTISYIGHGSNSPNGSTIFIVSNGSGGLGVRKI